jgi:hippurate hydrolase
MKSNLVEGLVEEVAGWRRHLHENPELAFQEVKTARFVAAKLREFSFDEVHEGIAGTGVVGVLYGKNGKQGRGIGLRADMDALPIAEVGDAPYKSKTPGVMHACGHDGHTSLLLGAAKGLAETRAFDGIAHFIFQPAEEDGGGADAMIRDGLFERFEMEEVYGLHNAPGLPVGAFEIRPGPLLAAADTFRITVKARGGHGGEPHTTADPVLTVAQIIVALQGLVSRETRAIDPAVLSVTQMSGSNASNIIPHEATLGGTVRTFEPADRDRIERRMKEVAAGVASAMGATAVVDYERGYPPTRNHPDQTRFAAAVARSVVGDANVDDACEPIMPAEDFAYMLEAKPGAYIFMGNGDSAQCHMPSYDFNDAAIPVGVSYWIALVEQALPAN